MEKPPTFYLVVQFILAGWEDQMEIDLMLS